MSPRMQELLVRLYPRRWRERYAAEFAELLAGTPLTAAVVLDVLRAAAIERWRASRALRAAAALLAFAVCEVAALRLGVTRNIFWPPTTPLRALMLAATVTPLAALARELLARRAARGT